MAYDRDEVLERTDLAALADELLGPHKGRGASASWGCPNPDHGPQTGRTPPLSVFRSHAGQERWRCHACGAGGTAADLVMVTQRVGFREAIEVLGRRAGASEDSVWLAPSLHRPSTGRAPLPRPVTVGPEIERHVAACEAYLWSPRGAPMRRWLARRGLREEVLRANRVGADPGPATLERPPGLPRAGPAVVLPVLGAHGRAVYLQARYLRPPGGRKYDNPAAAVAGPSPRLAEVRLAGPPAYAQAVVVCEGLPDALTVAQAGHRSVAVLGAGLPDDRVAAALVRRFPTERLVVAFDADDRGRAGAGRLVELLAAADPGHHVATLDVPGAWGDINGWQVSTGAGFGSQLAEALEAAARPPSELSAAQTGRTSPPLSEALETIHYEHVLVDSPALAARNVARIRAALERCEGSGSLTPVTTSTSRLDQRLESLACRYLLVDDRDVALGNLREAHAAVASWAAETPADVGRRSTWLALAAPARGADDGAVGFEGRGGPAPDLGLGIDP